MKHFILWTDCCWSPCNEKDWSTSEIQKKTSEVRYSDDMLSLNNSQFGNSIDLIYSNELESKYITESRNLLHIWTYNLNLTIRIMYTLGCMTNKMTLILLSLIVYISQLINYSRVCIFVQTNLIYKHNTVWNQMCSCPIITPLQSF